jgi:hypothetical protein
VGVKKIVDLLTRTGLADTTIEAQPKWDAESRTMIGSVMSSPSARLVFIHSGSQGEAWLAVLRRFWRRASPVLLHIGFPPIRKFDPGVDHPASNHPGHCSMPLPNLLGMLQFLSAPGDYRESETERYALFTAFGWRYEVRAKEQVLHKAGSGAEAGFRLLTELAESCSSYDQIFQVADELVRTQRGDVPRQTLAILHTIKRRWFLPTENSASRRDPSFAPRFGERPPSNVGTGCPNVRDFKNCKGAKTDATAEVFQRILERIRRNR